MRRIDHGGLLSGGRTKRKGEWCGGENGHLSSLLAETSHMKACLWTFLFFSFIIFNLARSLNTLSPQVFWLLQLSESLASSLSPTIYIRIINFLTYLQHLFKFSLFLLSLTFALTSPPGNKGLYRSIYNNHPLPQCSFFIIHLLIRRGSRGLKSHVFLLWVYARPSWDLVWALVGL